MVFLAEDVLRILPRGTHDPARFIKPTELQRKLETAGFKVGRFAGMGPRGLNRRLDITFGRLPTTAIQYLGQAIAA
jgi:2-polyprenyl-6-hydroxyphenyl methylase/3-demethylubiquinone-9 3-methyltransferase